jgi:hypothetical protein
VDNSLPITMSFGFGVGDFLAVLELAKNIRQSFLNAPAQYQSIANRYDLIFISGLQSQRALP